jgi:hypothetical protein
MSQENVLNLERELIAEASIKPHEKSIFNKITDWYFRPKSFEKDGRLYRNLGVKVIKNVCEFIGKNIKNLNEGKPIPKNNYVLWDKSKEGLKKFESKTRFNEKWHLPFVAFCGIFAIANSLDKDMGDAIFQGTCAGINAYAVMLQRYNRARLYNTIEKMEARDNLRKEYKEASN